MTRYHAEYAWLGGDQLAVDVLIEVDGSHIAAVTPGTRRAPDALPLRGVVLPGLANTHSHAFHRALRGRTQRGRGTFWTWREDMYAVADRLTPDSYHALARATYAEMALAGITCVGEFHYLHHDRAGTPYADANAFGEALIAAADEAGIRITLLDACYLTGGFGREPEGPQRRFGDADADAWAARVSELRDAPHARVGAAIHSVRAVPPGPAATVVRWAQQRDAPLHFHVSEQRAENEGCLTMHGRTPVALLNDVGALGARSCAVHATHLTDADVELLGGSRTAICMCPTTERDLADGIGPARALGDRGSPLCVGSDSHAVVDVLEEARAVELDQRLASEVRGHWRATELLHAATAAGHEALGWHGGGRLQAGAPADLVTVRRDSVRLAGSEPASLLESIVFAASAPDVRDVIVGGRPVVAEGRHLQVDDVPEALCSTIKAVLA